MPAGEQRAFLRTVVKNEALQILRRRYRRGECFGTDGAGEPGVPEHLDELIQARKDLWLAVQAIKEMPVTRRRVVILYVEGYRTGEIAAMLDISVSTVRSHMSNARRDLRRAVPGDWEGEGE
jgi:RNA polymerase sigma-70 factor (ECF subfamily)